MGVTLEMLVEIRSQPKVLYERMLKRHFVDFRTRSIRRRVGIGADKRNDGCSQ